MLKKRMSVPEKEFVMMEEYLEFSKKLRSRQGNANSLNNGGLSLKEYVLYVFY
jgi:hypothetical protein